MRRLLAFTLCSAVACAAGTANPPATAGAGPGLPKRYSDGEIATLVFAESDNPVRFCVGSALRTHEGRRGVAGRLPA